jgi:hypothetical protein
MSDNELDKLLNTHFAEPTPVSDFNALRRNVWQRIQNMSIFKRLCISSSPIL